MKEGAAVNVLVYPGWKTVPYNQCLYRDMANISFAQYHGAWFPLSRNLTSAHQVLHLHWTEDLFAVNEKNSFKFFVRYLISLIDIFYVRYVKRVPIIWTVHNLYAHNCVHLNADGFIRKLIGKIASVVIVHGERTSAATGNSCGATHPFGGSVACDHRRSARSHSSTRRNRPTPAR